MLILVIMGVGLLWYGRRATTAQLTAEERQMRFSALWGSVFRGGPERVLPVVGGLAIQFAGVIILWSALI